MNNSLQLPSICIIQPLTTTRSYVRGGTTKILKNNTQILFVDICNTKQFVLEQLDQKISRLYRKVLTSLKEIKEAYMYVNFLFKFWFELPRLAPVRPYTILMDNIGIGGLYQVF